MYEGTDSDGNPVRLPDLGGIEDSNPYTITGDNADGTEVLVAVTGTSTELDTARGATTTTELTDADAETWRADQGLPAAAEHSDVPDVEVNEMLDQFTPTDVLDTAEENAVRLVQNWTQDLSRDERVTVLNNHEARSVREVVTTATDTEITDIISTYNVGTIPSHLDTSTVARSVIQMQTLGFQVLQDQEVTAMNKAAKAKGLDKASELTKNTRSDMSGSMSDRARRLLGGAHADHADMMDYLKENVSTPPWDGDVNPPAKGSP